MKKKTAAITAAIAAVLLIAGITVYAATNYGSKDDPLVTLSYLTDKLTPSLMDQFNGNLNSAVNELKNEASGGSGVMTTYQLVTVASGQTLVGKTGTEVLLRDGGMMLLNNTGLADTTDGTAISAGATLAVNHLCMFSGDGALLATGNTRLLVRGSYTVG